MLHQWDQRTCADARQIGGVRARSYRLGKIRRRDANRPRPAVRQRDNDIGGTAPRPLLQHLKPVPEQKMMRVSDRDVRHDPLENRGTLTCSVTQPSATPSWTVSFTTLTAFSLPEKACERRTPAIKLLTPPQTPEPITMSVEAAAQDRVKYLLTIKRNERSPSSEIAAHHHRNAQDLTSATAKAGFPSEPKS